MTVVGAAELLNVNDLVEHRVQTGAMPIGGATFAGEAVATEDGAFTGSARGGFYPVLFACMAIILLAPAPYWRACQSR